MAPGDTDQRNAKAFREKFGRMNLENLKIVSIVKWLQDKRTKSGNPIQANTYRRYVNTINAIIQYSKDHGIPVPNLTLKRPFVNDARDRYLRPGERDELLESIKRLASHAHAIFVCLIFTRARSGELSKLKWVDVVVDPMTRATYIVVSSKKGDGVEKKRRLRLPKRALDVFPIRGASNKDDDFVFTNTIGGKFTKTTLGNALTPSLEILKIEDFRPHDCRHTFATLLVMMGVKIEDLAVLMGHSTTQMTARYRHHYEGYMDEMILKFDEEGGSDTVAVKRSVDEEGSSMETPNDHLPAIDVDSITALH